MHARVGGANGGRLEGLACVHACAHVSAWIRTSVFALCVLVLVVCGARVGSFVDGRRDGDVRQTGRGMQDVRPGRPLSRRVQGSAANRILPIFNTSLHAHGVFLHYLLAQPLPMY